MSFSANEDRKYIHDVVCKVQVVKFEPKSGLYVCVHVHVCMYVVVLCLCSYEGVGMFHDPLYSL